MSDWSATVHMVLLQKTNPQTPKQQKKPQSHGFPEKEDSERYHTQPWKEARRLILLWPFGMCAKLELYSATCLLLTNASISCISRVRHANQKGQAAWVGRKSGLFAWLEFPHPSKGKQSGWGKRRVRLCLWKVQVTSPSPLPWGSVALAALTCLFWRSCAESGVLSLLPK